jgi:hypothetical protein
MVGVDIHPSQTVLVVYTDASMEGWGVHSKHHSAHGLWSKQEQNLHVNVLELKAVFLALKAFVKFLINILFQVATGNTTVVACINNREVPIHGSYMLYFGAYRHGVIRKASF